MAALTVWRAMPRYNRFIRNRLLLTPVEPQAHRPY